MLCSFSVEKSSTRLHNTYDNGMSLLLNPIFLFGRFQLWNIQFLTKKWNAVD